jgi:hypothetical protein
MSVSFCHQSIHGDALTPIRTCEFNSAHKQMSIECVSNCSGIFAGISDVKGGICFNSRGICYRELYCTFSMLSNRNCHRKTISNCWHFFYLVRKIDNKVYKVFIAFVIMSCFPMSHAIAMIVKPVLFPSIVSPNTKFQIKYIIKNTGTSTGFLWAYLMVNGRKLSNSEWKRIIPVNGTATATYTHSGISKNTIIILKAGY